MHTEKLKNFLAAKNVELYEAVPSQSSKKDRTAFLELQSIVRAEFSPYVYLEIGSFLGGTLTPFCLDEACRTIYSIDARVLTAPNEAATELSNYGEHSSLAMRERLTAATGFDDKKLICFDCDARNVPQEKIDQKVNLVLIDGEHTNSAVVSDFNAVKEFLAPDAVIAFHDYSCVADGVSEISRCVDKMAANALKLKLDGEVYAIFLNSDIARRSGYVRRCIVNWRWFRLKRLIKRFVPGVGLRVCRSIRRILKQS